MKIKLNDYADLEVFLEEGDSDQLRRIIKNELPKWLLLYSAKNKGYKSMKRTLGPRGEFVEINRKCGKLEEGIWNGDPAVFASEDREEVVMDMIGHLFMMLDMFSEGIE